MTCSQPETESRDKIQYPIQSNSKTKDGACTGDSNGALHPCPSVWKTNTALNWKSDYHQVALVMKLPPLCAWPLAEWTMGKVNYAEGSAHSGIALMPRNVPQQNACVWHHRLESKQIHYLAFIQQLTTCLSDTRDMPFLLLFIFNFSIFNTTKMHTLGYTIQEDFKPSFVLGKLSCHPPNAKLFQIQWIKLIIQFTQMFTLVTLNCLYFEYQVICIFSKCP